MTIEEVKNSGRYAEDVLYEEQNSKRQEVLTLQGVKNASNGSLIYCANISHRCNQFPNSYDHINAVIIKGEKQAPHGQSAVHMIEPQFQFCMALDYWPR